jgi:hypothetical protein
MIDGNLYEGPIDVKNVLIIYQNIYLNVVNAGFKLATAAEEIDFSCNKCTLFVTRFFIYCRSMGLNALSIVPGLAWTLSIMMEGSVTQFHQCYYSGDLWHASLSSCEYR